jgi:hypothetical protein
MPNRRQRRRRLAAAGGAAVAAKKHRDNKPAAEEQASAPQAEPTDPAPAASGEITADTTQRLKELGQLHEQGVLTDEEFASEKAKVLGI